MSAYCIGTLLWPRRHTNLEVPTESAQKTSCQLRGSTNRLRVKDQGPDELHNTRVETKSWRRLSWRSIYLLGAQLNEPGQRRQGRSGKRETQASKKNKEKPKVPALYLPTVAELCVSGLRIKWWQDLNHTDTASVIIIIHHSLSAKPRRHQSLHTWTSSPGVFIFKFWHLAVSRPSPWPICPDGVMLSVCVRAVQILGRSKT